MLEQLARAIRNLIARAVLRSLEEGHGLRRVTVSILADEVKGGVEHVESYGFSARPHAGAEAVLVFPGGARDHALALALPDRRHRPKNLEAGEVVIYDDQGQEVRIRRSHVEVTAPKVVVLSDDVHLGAEGGPRVARIGDHVEVGAGSSAGLWPIVEGSTRVRAAD